MTPRELDPETLTSRLRAMRRLLDQLDRVGPPSIEPAVPDYAAGPDYGAQLQVERILSALVDLAVAVNTHVVVALAGQAPHDMTESFRLAGQVGVISSDLAKALAPSVGLRNILVYAYVDIDLGRMGVAIPLAARDYGRYVEQVAGWLRQRN